MKKTKIICTMGPASDDQTVMTDLVRYGMDIARFNFSHGTHEEQKARLDQLKRIRSELDVPVAALLDTKGPEIRTGRVKGGGKISLLSGQIYTLTTREVECDNQICSINYAGLAEDLKPGDRILIDDGLIELAVKKIEGEDLTCLVVNGGELGSQKGVNVPGVKIKLPALTDKDKEDILFGIEQGFDFIAASFVRSADAVLEIKEILKEHQSKMMVISKIENAEGLENLDEIIAASDGIMVARGDLGVEIPPQKVPFIQKTIIQKCNEACKPVITATQMLDSMIRNPRPTRAEVTDVSEAVEEGTDVVMLSGETAAGRYPVEALKMMVEICLEAESHLDYSAYRIRQVTKQNRTISNAVCFSSVSTAHDLGAKAIVAPSISGFTARLLSKWRSDVQVIGMSPAAVAVRQMQIYWGVRPFLAMRASSTDALIESSIEYLKEKGIFNSGDIAVVTAGLVNYDRKDLPAMHTNMMRIVNVA